jgi:hypothetical protein
VRPRLGLRGPELEQPLLHAVDHLRHLDHPHPDPQQPRLLLACVVMVRGVSLGCVRVRWCVCGGVCVRVRGTNRPRATRVVVAVA